MKAFSRIAHWTRQPSQRAFPPRDARWLGWSLAALLIMTVTFWGALLLRQTSVISYAYNRDFSSVYVGARAVAEGHGAELYNLELQRRLMDAAILPYHRSNMLPFIYPAYVAVLLSPLGAISLGKAFLVWAGINFLAAGWTATRLIRHSAGPVRQNLALLVTFFAWLPLQLTLSHGQFGLISVVAFTEALIALRVGKQWHAGGWLTLGLMKPQLLVFPLLALLLWGFWRTLLAFASASLVVIGISFAKLGYWIPVYLCFIANFNQKGGEVSLYPVAMQNWRGLIYALLKTDTSLAAYWLLAVLSVGSLIAMVLICYQPRSSRENIRFRPPLHWEARFAIAILLGILSSPYLYLHDWVIALPAAFVLFAFIRDLPALPGNRHGSSVALGWLLGLAPFVCVAVQFGIWPTSSPVQLLPWYMGVLVVTAILTVRNQSVREMATIRPA